MVDLTRVLAGPFGTEILGDMGAEIIKVESPRGGDPVRTIGPYVNGQSHYFLSLNRNKKSFALDLRQPAAREVLGRLLGTADILIENFRPGVLASLDLDPSDLRVRFPGLVICSISGFGQTGPWYTKASFDVVTQALAGAMSVTGEPGRPPVRLGLPLGDLIGGLYGAIAVIGSLYARNTSGEGVHIDLALHDSLVSLLGYMAGRYFATGEILGPVGSGHHTSVPYGAFAAKDGYIVVACMTDNFWPRICEAIGRPDMGVDPRYDSYDKRHATRVEVNAAVAEALATATVAEWCEVFEEMDIPHAPILDIAGVVEHPQTVHRNMIREFAHSEYGSFRTVGSPIKYAGHGDEPVTPPPILGEHSDEILDELGYSAAEIDSMRLEALIA